MNTKEKICLNPEKTVFGTETVIDVFSSGMGEYSGSFTINAQGRNARIIENLLNGMTFNGYKIGKVFVIRQKHTTKKGRNWDCATDNPNDMCETCYKQYLLFNKLINEECGTCHGEGLDNCENCN